MRNQLSWGLLLALGLLASSCSTKSGLAGRVETEVKEKYLKTFNDPASYESVENKYDSVGYSAYRQSLLAGIRQNDIDIKALTASIAKCKNTDGLGAVGLFYGMERAQQLFDKQMSAMKECMQARSVVKKHRAGLIGDTTALARLKLTSHDVYMVHVKHIYRAKNPAGALQRGAFDFDYFPKRDSLVLVANNPAYAEGPTAP